MYLLGSSIVLVLAFISSVTEARPDLVDSVIGAISDVVYDDCQEISDPNVCAIGQQKKKCWTCSLIFWQILTHYKYALYLSFFLYLVYDDEDCGQGDLAWISSSLTWEPLKIGIGESKSFSLLKDLSHLYKYKNDIESFVVRKGCTLKVSLFLLYLVVKLIYRQVIGINYLITGLQRF